MSDIFISYAKKDRDEAQKLAKALEPTGSVWWDRAIPTGRVFEEVIEEEIDKAQAVIVLWSSDSIASEWVKREAQRARDQRKLFPVLIGAVEPPWVFKDLQACALADWDGSREALNFRRLVADLESVLGEGASPGNIDESPPSAPTPVWKRKEVLVAGAAALAVIAWVLVSILGRSTPQDSGLWSVDIQGVGGSVHGQKPPILMIGKEEGSGLGNVWNAFNVPGANLPPKAPALFLKDSEGRPTEVQFEIAGDPVQGFSIGTSGSTDLHRDYLFVGPATASAAFTMFAVKGLEKKQEYSMWLYSGADRSAVITVSGKRALVPAGGAVEVPGLRANSEGVIGGTVEAVNEGAEGNWGGFQLVRAGER